LAEPELGRATMSEIVLVGGRADQLRLLEAVLAPLGYPLAAATSGAEAVHLLGEREVALLIVVSAGATNRDSVGWLETARLIKAQGHEVPVVFLAADAAEADAARETEAAPGYWVGIVDYVLPRSDPQLLRSTVVAFAELETSRVALKRSDALLRGAFEAAPIGKTVLDDARRIVRANPAFAVLLDHESAELLETDIASLAHPDDREQLVASLTRAADGELGPNDPDRSGFDVRLKSSSGSYVWTCAYLSSIDPAELEQPLLMIQWVDVTPRRHAERARAALELEHSARAQAEATAERLNKLQVLSHALEMLSVGELLPELALRLAEQFDAQLVEVRVKGREDKEPVVVRAAAGRVLNGEQASDALPPAAWHETALMSEGTEVGSLRLVPSAQGSFADADRSLLADLADRAVLSIRRAQLHEQEHRIAATLQRGLLPTRPPQVPGIELTTHYEPAGDVAEVGGDWYDAFALSGERLGIVLGDVAGKGITAASIMGQVRSVTRAFALGDEQERAPGDVLTRLNRYQLALGAEDMFTVLYAIIDPRRGSVSWANAGHPPPLLQTAAGERRYLDGGDGLMGLEDIVYTELHRQVGNGDTLIFYTDGLVERRGESLDTGLDRLARAVAAGPDDPRALCRHILSAVVPAERTPSDDVTIVLARIV
jgi:PAS domain S-box-containing protein